jgi:hypothetical protein
VFQQHAETCQWKEKVKCSYLKPGLKEINRPLKSGRKGSLIFILKYPNQKRNMDLTEKRGKNENVVIVVVVIVVVGF